MYVHFSTILIDIIDIDVGKLTQSGTPPSFARRSTGTYFIRMYVPLTVEEPAVLL